MTTATTILGLLPMALGLGDGAEIRTPMALTVIFGLATSTLLTLVIIPLIYHLVETLRDRILGPASATETEPEPQAPSPG
jgi:HAE1 family hydrophobic/amphiphilic exporter-1